MKITVLNGSPKLDKFSSTMTFIRYIQKVFPAHNFEIINVGILLTRMTISEQRYLKIIEEIKNSDGVIWAFPVYTMLVPAQLKRFIELIWERKVENVFKNKYSCVLSTSMNFFDHTAHNYMRSINEDLNMNYTGFHSVQMDFLLDPQKRRSWYLFIENFLYSIKNEVPVSKMYRPLRYSDFKYTPGENHSHVNNSEKKVTIVTDCDDPSSNLSKMIDQFTKAFTNQSNIEIINLNDVNIKGGCLGCIKCGFDNECVYKDEFVEFFREKIMNKPIMIYAAEIKDRYYSHKWKMYFDRMFHNGHTPSLQGTQFAHIVSGPLDQIANMRQIIYAQAECAQANLVDIVEDNIGDSKQIDILLNNLAVNLIRFSNKNYVATPTFLEVGGFKIFRDLIYGLGRTPFPSDYKYFKKNKMFDFPTKEKKWIALGRISSVVFKNKKIRNKFRNKLGEFMIFASEKFLKKMDVEEEMNNVINSEKLAGKIRH